MYTLSQIRYVEYRRILGWPAWTDRSTKIARVREFACGVVHKRTLLGPSLKRIKDT